MIMSKGIHILQPKMLEQMALHNPDLFLGDNFAMLNRINPSLVSQMSRIARVPQYVEVGRVIRVTQGHATFHINLVPTHVEAGNLLIIPENNYIEINELSDDIDVQIISFKNLPVSFARCTVLRLGEMDFERTGNYLQLIWQVIHKPAFSMRTVELLLSALMNDVQHVHQQEQQSKHVLTHSELVTQQFMDLVAEHGTTQRNVGFYAEQLRLTPNHLSTFVKQHTGKSVMQWLNERTILQAKVLLKHTDLPISDIAYQLSFSEVTLFSRFFRRETGSTPKSYRAT